MKINRNKQKGMASLVALIIVAAALTLGVREWSAWLSKNRIQENSQSFYNRIVFLNTQFHAYMSDKYLSGTSINSSFLFPVKFSDLEGDYIPICSSENNKNGYCFRYNQTPWGDISDSDYRKIPMPDGINPTHWRAELDIELPSKNNEALKYEREMVLQLFGANMPNIMINDAKDKITLRIDRPDKAFGYESLVKRSGDDSTLLGDWDVGGNHAITNAKDYTIRNSDGSQQLVSTGLVKILQVNHGDFIDKPKCPEHQQPDLTLSIHTVTISNKYNLTGSIKPFIRSETASQWQAGLEIRAIENATGKNKILTTGVMTAFVQCK